MVIPIMEDLQEELDRLSAAMSVLISGPSYIVDDIIEVEIDSNILTISPITINEHQFYFVISEGTDNHIALRSALYTEMEIRLPMPTYLRVGDPLLMAEEDLC